MANNDFSSLAKKYGLMCKSLVENPEQRTNYWEQKGSKIIKWKKKNYFVPWTKLSKITRMKLKEIKQIEKMTDHQILKFEKDYDEMSNKWGEMLNEKLGRMWNITKYENLYVPPECKKATNYFTRASHILLTH